MLNSKQRALLKSYVSTQDSVCFVGKDGLSEAVIDSITKALLAREVIKITVLQNCELSPREVADQLQNDLKVDVVAVIGKKVIVYKYSANIKKHVDISVSNK